MTSGVFAQTTLVIPDDMVVQNQNPYASDLSPVVVKKLEWIISKVSVYQSEFSWADFRIMLDEFSDKVDDLSDDYEKNTVVENIVKYLKYEISQLKVDPEVSDFLCRLDEDCFSLTESSNYQSDDIKSDNVNIVLSSTTKKSKNFSENYVYYKVPNILHGKHLYGGETKDLMEEAALNFCIATGNKSLIWYNKSTVWAVSWYSINFNGELNTTPQKCSTWNSSLCVDYVRCEPYENWVDQQIESFDIFNISEETSQDFNNASLIDNQSVDDVQEDEVFDIFNVIGFDWDEVSSDNEWTFSQSSQNTEAGRCGGVQWLSVGNKPSYNLCFYGDYLATEVYYQTTTNQYTWNCRGRENGSLSHAEDLMTACYAYKK